MRGATAGGAQVTDRHDARAAKEAARVQRLRRSGLPILKLCMAEWRHPEQLLMRILHETFEAPQYASSRSYTITLSWQHICYMTRFSYGVQKV
jgi:hypothetical protein